MVDEAGKLRGAASQPTQTWTNAPQPPLGLREVYEQSGQDIWSQLCLAVREACAAADVGASQVQGIGVDATCSLVATSSTGESQAVSPVAGRWGRGNRNVMLWRDLRAAEDASVINATHHPVLSFTGGSMGAEMILPRLRWLARHMPSEEFGQTQFFLLPDYLTWRMTSVNARSHGTMLACGLGYQPCSPGPAQPSADFFASVGLERLVEQSFHALGGMPGKPGSALVLSAGIPIGEGLTSSAADQLGLRPGTAVASGLIDGYAGWLGTAGAGARPHLEASRHRLALVVGTSTCMDIQYPSPLHVPGIWGPWDVIFPGMYMSEGGQPAAGALVDHILRTHPAFPTLSRNGDPYIQLSRRLDDLVKTRDVRGVTDLTRDRMIYPDFHGNRAPLGDDHMRGIIFGLRLDATADDLCLWYLAALEALVLQIRHVVMSLTKAGHEVEMLVLSGSVGGNHLFVQLLGKVIELPIALPLHSEAAVPIGSAILARHAAHLRPPRSQVEADILAKQEAENLWSLATTMTTAGNVVTPRAAEWERELLEAKYSVYLDMITAQRRWRAMLDDAA